MDLRNARGRGARRLPRPRPRPWVLLMALFGGVLAAYAATCLLVLREDPVQEATYKAGPTAVQPAVFVYAEVMAVDPVRSAIELRVDFGAGGGRTGLHFPVAPARDMMVEIVDGESEQDIALRAGQPNPTETLFLGLGAGRLQAYPFDRYEGEIALNVHDGLRPDGPVLPFRVLVADSLAAWEVHTREVPVADGEPGIALRFEVRRPPLQRLLAVTLYAAIGVMALIAAAVSTLLTLGVRRADTTFASVLAAMVFTIPAIRNTMPGAPPFGVAADMLVFLWAEILVVLSLGLVVLTWARRGDGK
ncbi:MAG: hypothetical protein BGO51_20400 [Rhodospirillales bacterium 69-11]|nr:DUF4436 family protein [Rhodospirillales bacterium]OJW27744.1 MAG: hypothetical protein BGO51_20400 [Rhodospirillales bacterium 69-11]